MAATSLGHSTADKMCGSAVGGFRGCGAADAVVAGEAVIGLEPDFELQASGDRACYAKTCIQA